VSFSEDRSPTAPFIGDETGGIFDSPDLVSQSPTTTERVVDTQSGFLVVIKKIDTRLALSVKRRIGTPPVSSILLTPDESLKLANILSTPLENGAAAAALETISPQVDAWLSSVESNQIKGFERSFFRDRTRRVPSEHSDALDHIRREIENKDRNGNSSADTSKETDSETDDLADKGSGADTKELEKTQSEKALKELPNPGDITWDKIQIEEPGNFFVRNLSKILNVVVLAAAVSVGAFVTSLYLSHKEAAPAPAPVIVAPPPAESPEVVTSRKIEKFATAYVSNLLDFNQPTYRYSQVKAMAAMTPEQMTKYWKETHFPISLSQLKGSGGTVAIEKVEQAPGSDPTTHTADVYANLTSGKTVSPVRLRLTIVDGEDGQFNVTSQEDISASKK